MSARKTAASKPISKPKEALKVKHSTPIPERKEKAKTPFPKRTIADFPPPKPLPLGKDRYFGQTVKLLKSVYKNGLDQSENEFALAIDGEFGTYQGTRILPDKENTMQEHAVIKLKYGTAFLIDDGTRFEVVD